jgi:hypothetical protein
MRVVLKRLIIAAALTGLVQATLADATTALIGWTGGAFTTPAANQLFGWTFTLSQPINITAFGVYDNYGNELADAHDVGIFRMLDQSLVASATLPAGKGGFLENGFRYMTLPSPVTLSVGDYEILMTLPAGSLDPQIVNASNVITAPGITWLHSAFNDGSTLKYVTNFGPFEQGMFGPNFQFVSATVPEPATLALVGAALLGATATRRRKPATATC